MEIINYWCSSRHIKPRGIQLSEECKLFKSLTFNCFNGTKSKLRINLLIERDSQGKFKVTLRDKRYMFDSQQQPLNQILVMFFILKGVTGYVR